MYEHRFRNSALNLQQNKKTIEMSSIGAIIETYEDGMEAKRQKNYLRAARLFRMCSCYYEEGELPEFFEKVKRYGEDAMSQFEECNSMLTKKAQRMLKKEERNLKKFRKMKK